MGVSARIFFFGGFAAAGAPYSKVLRRGRDVEGGRSGIGEGGKGGEREGFYPATSAMGWKGQRRRGARNERGSALVADGWVGRDSGTPDTAIGYTGMPDVWVGREV